MNCGNISEDQVFVGKDQENLKADHIDSELHTQTIRNQINEGQRSLYLVKFEEYYECKGLW